MSEPITVRRDGSTDLRSSDGLTSERVRSAADDGVVTEHPTSAMEQTPDSAAAERVPS